VLTFLAHPRTCSDAFTFELPLCNKKPAHRKASAAGKCLMQMDLPLAASGPSPPGRSRHGLRLARHHQDARPNYQSLAALLPRPTRARFEFAARTHREEIYSVL
jgi:hypothetical protein